MYLAGIDIGGTTCGLSLARINQDKNSLVFIDKVGFSTPDSPELSIEKFKNHLEKLINKEKINNLEAIGISSGGPLDIDKGLIKSPPNLTGWDDIDIITPFARKFNTRVGLQNDANAGALAEWYFGAGRGASNLIFLTFGTGMGAGLILDNSLYSGTNDMAGEIGHIRLEKEGPVGYGKSGSFEGFCSGGGIARLARMKARKAIEKGNSPSFCNQIEDLEKITAKKVGIAAQNGDKLARKIFKIVGEKLGYGLSILIDIINPEKIIIGSIYPRQQSLLEPIVSEKIKQEALSLSLSVCEIVPSALDEDIGDYASISVGLELLEQKNILEKVSENN